MSVLCTAKGKLHNLEQRAGDAMHQGKANFPQFPEKFVKPDLLSKEEEYTWHLPISFCLTLEATPIARETGKGHLNGFLEKARGQKTQQTQDKTRNLDALPEAADCPNQTKQNSE